ncbi:hypothetical protein ABKN59_008103 [Abortiporus biennis]
METEINRCLSDCLNTGRSNCEEVWTYHIHWAASGEEVISTCRVLGRLLRIIRSTYTALPAFLLFISSRWDVVAFLFTLRDIDVGSCLSLETLLHRRSYEPY